jgi:type VII secretion integral membrane protein EccD
VTGVGELRAVEVVSAAPDQFRVSVLGGNTQLDVALPADVPVAAFLPELAQLIRSRAGRRDDEVADRDERRTFWVLSRVDGDAVLAPDETLRGAGISNGELLRISARRALSPPMLYDDVVDAAARLNRAAYAAWSPAAAKVMAFAGLWLIAAVWVIFLSAEALRAHRTVVVIGAGFTTVILIGGAALVRRVLNLTDIAGATGWAALAMTAALVWVLVTPWSTGGLAVGCAILLVLTGVYHRVIGTGHWAYIAAAVALAFGGAALVTRALGVPVVVVASVTTIVAALSCLAIPALTRRLARFPTSATDDQRRAGDPFMPSAEIGSAAAIPTAEQVSDRVRAAELARAGLLTGAAVVVVAGAAVVLNARTEFSALSFALACAAVLALRSRRAPTWSERTALAGPAVALVLIACSLAQSGDEPLRLAGLGVLVGVAVLTTLAGVVGTGRWMSAAAAYLDYAFVAALVPLALWPLGIYDRLGL